jgi:peptidoglycan-N-acetylglucosamine deacetylase
MHVFGRRADSRVRRGSRVPAMSWGRCVRRIPSSSESPLLYLSFDDGPLPEGTPAVLDALSEHDCPATFFVVAKRAERSKGLVSRMISAGHAIGNHSLDHTWGPYFRGPSVMLRWIEEAERRLQDLCGIQTVGFRSPAGVRTPLLHWALNELNLPLVHWDLRSFDRARTWTRNRAVRSLDGARPGSIVLLHDIHSPPHLDGFLCSLRDFLIEAKRRGFKFAALDRQIVQRALTEG